MNMDELLLFLEAEQGVSLLVTVTQLKFVDVNFSVEENAVM